MRLSPNKYLRCNALTVMTKITLSTLLFSFSAILSTSVLAAPPGVQLWLTLAGPDLPVNGECGATEDLFSIGFIGSTGSGCLSLPNSTIIDEHSLDYELWNGCTINLYSSAECSDADIVDTVPSPPPNTGSRGCEVVEEGFRALQVTCTS